MLQDSDTPTRLVEPGIPKKGQSRHLHCSKQRFKEKDLCFINHIVFQ